MAFNRLGFRWIAFGGTLAGTGQPMKHGSFITNDLASEVVGSGYFNDLANEVNKGDRIDASVDMDGTPQGRSYMVTSANGVTPVTTAQVLDT